jgi:TonB family protein
MFRSLDPGAELLGHSRFWGNLGIGYVTQIFLVSILLLIRLLVPMKLVPPSFPMEVTWLTPAVPSRAPEPEPVKQAPAPPRATLLAAAPTSSGHLELPPVEAPPVLSARPAMEPTLPAAPSRVPTLAPQPKLGTFATSQLPGAPAALPPSKLQTGGFGDPNGLPGAGPGNGRLIAARVGAFDLPKGEGYGNGTSGSQGVPGRVASSGFSQTAPISAAAARMRLGQGQTIAHSGFGDVVPVLSIRPIPAQTAGPPVSPAVVTSKPNPAYTDEARRLRIEGEVVMEVMFPKTGKPQVLHIFEKLGHGLDESAITAVTKIEFKPAQQAGSPVDSKAMVRVVFKLA